MADSPLLLTILSSSIQSFLQPSSSLHSESLAYLKSILDPLAVNVATAQKLKRDENRRKRKRSDVEQGEEILQLRQVYTNGLEVKQVWEQARRILDAACTEIERDISGQKSRQRLDLEEHTTTNGHNGDIASAEEE